MDAPTSTTNLPAIQEPEPYSGNLTPPPNLTGKNAAECNPSDALVPLSDHRPFPMPEAVLSLATIPKPRSKRKPDAIDTQSTPPCTECGKRFPSWKALFGHMRCHPERQWRGINPPPHFRRPLFSPLPPCQAHFTDEEHDVAASLIMLANCPPRDSDMPHSLYCISCGRAFGSQKALARHRASHKCIKSSEGGETVRLRDGGSNKRRWVESAAMGSDHKCNVCSRGFASGQALGGHLRCHWEKVGEPVVESCSSAKCYVLDLNLPPPVEGNEGSSTVPSSALDLKLGVF